MVSYFFNFLNVKILFHIKQFLKLIAGLTEEQKEDEEKEILTEEGSKDEDDSFLPKIGTSGYASIMLLLYIILNIHPFYHIIE